MDLIIGLIVILWRGCVLFQLGVGWLMGTAGVGSVGLMGVVGVGLVGGSWLMRSCFVRVGMFGRVPGSWLLRVRMRRRMGSGWANDPEVPSWRLRSSPAGRSGRLGASGAGPVCSEVPSY